MREKLVSLLTNNKQSVSVMVQQKDNRIAIALLIAFLASHSPFVNAELEIQIMWRSGVGRPTHFQSDNCYCSPLGPGLFQ